MADSKLANKIINLRERKDMKQSELARRLGLDKSSMSKIENGTRKVSSDELNKLADIFEVTADYLLGRKVDLGDVPVAAHIDGEFDGLTEEERQEIMDYIEFKKAQYKKRHEKD
ncbi:XRE family transcriptional regulator [Lactobacillus brevis] [Lactiplantibacillus mudanjiangensis]|uniref:helix-turn-helix domain-containing protein n=1 Tax=Lactiplantibacillus mudanjiangensis TaxID=1296538 RepID=UPI001013FCF0|nr:helix-turn-helix transcriptional regulator [Lactiplantibacillus mudanjiangensis]VDG33333.1 XRE family transcriptional regulator [Lactobacillus brevis] [Lactiplantibacillus mudanjiangensis]